MSEQSRGELILKGVPSGEVEQKVITFLAQNFKKVSQDKVAEMVKKAPVVLSKNVSQKVGPRMVAKLEELGAAAAYMNAGSMGSKEVTAPSDTAVLQETSPLSQHVPPSFKPRTKPHWKTKFIDHLEKVNKELWLILSMVLIVGLMNYLLSSHRLLLGLYTLPVLFSAYYYGRRLATLTAFASIFLVGLAVHFNPSWFAEVGGYEFVAGHWYDITVWGGTLVVTAYAMGTLYERNAARMQELQHAYRGLMVILRHFISKDKYTENHCYRVSIYAAKIAAQMGFNYEQIEDIRSAAFLHDIGKLDISRQLLYKASQLSEKEFEGMKRHVAKGAAMLEAVGGPLARIIPIIIAHHDKYDGSGYHPTSGEGIPLEARVLAVADVYDALTSDRPYRKAMSPFDAREIIVKGSGTEFDPIVVEAFLKAFSRGEMEVPHLVV